MIKRTILMNPGPVNVSDRVRNALTRGDLCHREKEFSGLMASIRFKLLQAFGLGRDYTAALISGSGTAALEMGVSSCLSPGKRMLIIENGVYGERITRMAEAYGLNFHVLNYRWGEPPDIEDIDSALNQYKDIEVVAMVHHETTTGLLNPLTEVAQRVKRFQKKFLVDCISSLGGETIDFQSCSIDFVIGTANKCLHGLPGVAFVLHRKEDFPRLNAFPARSVYFDLASHLAAQDKGEVLFTPSVQAHYALDEALNELLEETVKGRINRYREACTLLRRGFANLGLQFLLPEDRRSNCLTSLILPEGISYSWLHDRLKDNGFVIYAGQGNLNEQIFRVANMGDIRTSDLERFLSVLRQCLTTSIPAEKTSP